MPEDTEAGSGMNEPKPSSLILFRLDLSSPILPFFTLKWENGHFLSSRDASAVSTVTI